MAVLGWAGGDSRSVNNYFVFARTRSAHSSVQVAEYYFAVVRVAGLVFFIKRVGKVDAFFRWSLIVRRINPERAERLSLQPQL